MDEIPADRPLNRPVEQPPDRSPSRPGEQPSPSRPGEQPPPSRPGEQPSPARPGEQPAERRRAPGVLASDAERERIAETLRQAAGEGRLTLAELDERLAAGYAARWRGELPPLVADLPAPEPERGPGPMRGRPARARGGSAALVVHAVLVGLLAVALVTRWAAGMVPFFWPAFPIFWALLTLVVHARVRGYGPPGGRGPTRRA
ncbi:MAG TPA: DUF1707 domain-containing protein [Pseudonocardia sp.]